MAKHLNAFPGYREKQNNLQFIFSIYEDYHPKLYKEVCFRASWLFFSADKQKLSPERSQLKLGVGSVDKDRVTLFRF